MASLVTVTKEGRLLLKIGGGILGVFFVIYLFIKGGSIIQTVFFPKPPPVPKEALGKLPRLSFPSIGTPGIAFKVNTTNGALPTLPDRVNVYKLKLAEPNLLALEQAKKTLERESFVDNQIKLSDTLYQWSQTRTGAIIQYDIVSRNFTVSSNYLTNPFLASQKSLPDEEIITRDVHDFVKSLSESASGIDQKKTTVEFLELQNGVLVPAENVSKARYARVTLHQSDVDDIQIIYDTPTDSILNFLVSYPSNMQVLEGIYYNHEPNLDESSDYPIKTASQALEDLKNGNGYMINPKNLTNVDILNVELKYYLNKNIVDYLLPVIVFTGIDFTGYVEAIPPTSLAN